MVFVKFLMALSSFARDFVHSCIECSRNLFFLDTALLLLICIKVHNASFKTAQLLIIFFAIILGNLFYPRRKVGDERSLLNNSLL